MLLAVLHRACKRLCRRTDLLTLQGRTGFHFHRAFICNLMEMFKRPRTGWQA